MLFYFIKNLPEYIIENVPMACHIIKLRIINSSVSENDMTVRVVH